LRSKIIAVVLALGVALAVFAAEPTPGKATSSAKKKTTKKTSSKTATSKTASKSKAKSKTGSKQTSKQVATRYRQTQPSVDRYKEIQQSLSDRGYFKGSVDGAWGADSVDALKRFQRDQNIGDDGKLGSLSLIALGLGPKRDGKSSPGTTPEAQ
jgi:murein L,D-transpeptidase YcbB/YkuD